MTICFLEVRETIKVIKNLALIRNSMRLTIIRKIKGKKFPCGAKLARVRVKCECGTIKSVLLSSIKNGDTTSCGCYQKEIAAKLCIEKTKHKEARNGQRTTEYRSWGGLRERCLNSKNKDYKDYGGRGIKVCLRWNKYENFLADMGRKPDNKYSIDRINVNGNYEPTNCRWATGKQQAYNKRRRIK